jgi:hypothetical protein
MRQDPPAVAPAAENQSGTGESIDGRRTGSNLFATGRQQQPAGGEEKGRKGRRQNSLSGRPFRDDWNLSL